MFVQRPPQGLRSLYARCLHSSRPLCDRVGPPHPISHMRPMIYDDDAPASTSRASHHPYSLHEFDPEPTSPYKLQWKLQRQQIDEFHHSFWLESNTRFERGKDEALSRLPSTATALDKERALSEFYQQWLRKSIPTRTRTPKNGDSATWPPSPLPPVSHTQNSPHVSRTSFCSRKK
ncbi:hypothetical protein K438DRAFT_1806173, partial [Mycena galopus ATCC 62051]